MQETQHTKHKATRTAPQKKYSKCIGLSNDKDRRTQANYRHTLGGDRSIALVRSVTIVAVCLKLVMGRQYQPHTYSTLAL